VANGPEDESSSHPGTPARRPAHVSAPALGASDRPTTPDLQHPDFETNERLAVVAEMRHVIRLGLGVAAIAVALLLLTLARALGVLPVVGAATEASADPWAQSMLAVLLLLVAAQVVPLLIVVEHRLGPVLVAPSETGPGTTAADVEAPPGAGHRWRRGIPPMWRRAGRGTPAPFSIWAVRGALVVLSVAAVATEWMPVGWWWVFGVGVLLETVALALLLRAHGSHPREAGSSGRAAALATTPGDDGGPRQAGAEPPDPGAEQPPRLLAVGASGGGIRAAAFVLGGMQSLQEAAAELGAAEDEPEVFAVSGGSYTAAALALRRRFDLHGAPIEPAAPWTSVYRPDSPEQERLRRHTRYLFEPGARLREGAVALLLGATLNIVVVAFFLLTLSWVSVLLAKVFGVVSAAVEDGRVVSLDVTEGWGAGQWAIALSPALLAVAAIVGLTVSGWREARVFDQASPDPGRRAEARRGIDRAQRWRARLLVVAVAWLAVVFGLPAAAAGLTALTTTNQPTTTLASVLHSAGFSTTPMCQQAFDRSLADAAVEAAARARTSPDEPATASAGACGYETTVTRTLNTQGDSDPENDVLPGSGADALVVGWKPTAAIQLGGIGALLAAVVALLRRGPSPEAEAEATWRGRLTRRLLIWLPLVLTGLVAAYLVLLWTFHFLIELRGPGTSSFVAWSAGMTVVAAALCLLADANATSMHGYYRSRLADAFSVGTDGRRAAELPPERVYRFSELDGVRLNIVATLNSRFPNEAPTMRGGFPLVFSPTTVVIPREERRYIEVDTEDFEDYAGAGRTSVMAAVAVSGAAISPLMGRFGVQIAPYRVLLTLFNLRVGTWVRNPLHSRRIDYSPGAGRHGPAPEGWLWLTSKPGLVQLASEALFAVSANDRWIYLSDGGHLDNTGLVECVRHCVRMGRTGRIVVLDASNDPPGTWSAVGDAIAVIRADLNVDLRRVVPSEPAEDTPATPGGTLPPWARRYAGGGLDVLVVKAIRVDPADSEDPGAADWNAHLPPNVASFQLVTKDFPRASTTRQKFGDLEFEAYRGLGYSCVRLSLEAAGWVAPDLTPPT
jgi:hypothetical protein